MALPRVNSMGYTQEDMDRLWPDNPNFTRTRKKTHCANGHERTEENTGTNSRGDKRCRICYKLTQERRDKARRAKAKANKKVKTSKFHEKIDGKDVVVRLPNRVFYSYSLKKRLVLKDIDFNTMMVVDSKTEMNVSGTYKEMQKAAQVKGKHNNSKLTETQVLEIRKRTDAGESCRQIAKDYSIGKDTVRLIKLRQLWRFL